MFSYDHSNASIIRVRSIFPSQQEPGTIQIPIGNNTGSLPDLTSFQFRSPIHTPLDQDDHQSSTYSSAVRIALAVFSKFGDTEFSMECVLYIRRVRNALARLLYRPLLYLRERRADSRSVVLRRTNRLVRLRTLPLVRRVLAHL